MFSSVRFYGAAFFMEKGQIKTLTIHINLIIIKLIGLIGANNISNHVKGGDVP